MLLVLEDNVRPFSISNTFTTLLALSNDEQGDKETIHEFRVRFEGHVGALYQILGTLLRLLPPMAGPQSTAPMPSPDLASTILFSLLVPLSSAS